MVFDEIDAGIGGTTAHAVAETLRRLAVRAQVVTITHLPQIATVADRHFAVEKIAGDPTHTRIEPLDDAQRRDELERMLGGADFLASIDRGAEAARAESCSLRARTSGSSSPSPTTCPTGGPGITGVEPDRRGFAPGARWKVQSTRSATSSPGEGASRRCSSCARSTCTSAGPGTCSCPRPTRRSGLQRDRPRPDARHGHHLGPGWPRRPCGGCTTSSRQPPGSSRCAALRCREMAGLQDAFRVTTGRGWSRIPGHAPGNACRRWRARRHGQVRLRHRRRRLVARQGDHRRLARPAAQGARAEGAGAEVRPVHQRRPGDDEPVPARRGVRHRGRRRDRPRHRPLRALHRREPLARGEPHRRRRLGPRAAQGAQGRVPRLDRAGDPAHHERDQGAHPLGRGGDRHRRRDHGDRRARSATSSRSRSSRRSASSAARSAPRTSSTSTSRSCRSSTRPAS